MELVERERQHVEDANGVIDSWIESFNMQLDDNGEYNWQANLPEQHDLLIDKYHALLKNWNAMISEYNSVVAPKDIGRPLAASEAQIAKVLKLHAEGIPQRLIVDEVKPLGRNTIRTIIGRQYRTDRTSVKRIERLGIDKTELVSAKVRKRSRDALPKRIKQTLDQGAELIREAKGLGRAR